MNTAYHPYNETLNHQADFRVKYIFYDEESGGRHTIPFQGYRSDFWYENDGHDLSKLFMIWPEFENENGSLITDNNIPVPSTGTARMWIVNSVMRRYHKNKIRVGLKGYFMEGNRKVAECEIIEMLDLFTNPED